MPEPYYSCDGVTLLHGDCRDVLAALPAESVSCCVTSPPFHGLRKYECEPTVWGGQEDCQHEWAPLTGNEGETYRGRRRWQHAGVSRQETPEEWLKEQAVTLPGEDEGRSSPVKEAGDLARIGNGEPDMPSPLPFAPAGENTSLKQEGAQTVDEGRTSGAESNPPGLVDPAIPIKDAPNEIPGEGRGDGGPRKNETLARAQAEFHQPLHGRDRPEMNLDAIDRGARPEASGNKGQHVTVLAGETQGTTLGDMPIGTQQPEDVGASPCPSVKQGDPEFPFGDTHAGQGTETDRRIAAQPPTGNIEAATATLASDLSARSPIGPGQTPVMAHESMICQKCGAVNTWYGLEPTVATYVEHTIEVLRAIRRVLRKDGVVWWDLDDSRGGTHVEYAKPRVRWQHGETSTVERGARSGTPAKSLCLIPQRVAIAAQEDGWIVRSQIVIPSWMPESARDRPTDSYRVVLMLCKNRKYWYDAAAVRQRCADSTMSDSRLVTGRYTQQPWEPGYPGGNGEPSWYRSSKMFPQDGMRSLGNIWEIPPSAWPAQHFATFPVREPEIAILASCPAEVCVKCGKPRARIVKNDYEIIRRSRVQDQPKQKTVRESGGSPLGFSVAAVANAIPQTLGWTDCGCSAGFEPGLVLDPFIGTGTTAVAAVKLGRRCIGIDLSEDYLKQAVTRLTVGDAGVRRMVKAARDGARQEPLL